MIRKLYNKYKQCVVRVTVELRNGDFSNGTAFHIGNGYLVTARHVVENNKIQQIQGYSDRENLEIQQIYYSDNELIDLAIIKTNFSLKYYMEKVDAITIGGHLNDFIGDELVLSKVLLMGYPPIPFSKGGDLVAAEGEVNAIIDKYIGNHPHFILSTMARGGFSGGPVISEYGFLLGVVVESLIQNNQSSELGYLSAISIEPILDIIKRNNIQLCNENDELIDWFY